MKKENFFSKNKYILITLAICFATAIIAEMGYLNSIWIYDTNDYWNRGEMIKSSGFKIDSIDGFRGYIFPLFLAAANFIGGRNGFFVLNAILVSIFGAFIIPGFNKESKGFEKNDLFSTSIFFLLLCLLFSGAIGYPLSDLFASIIIFVSVLFLKKSIDTDNKALKLIFAFLSGAFAYLAYNTRTIYLFACFTMPVIYIIMLLRQEEEFSFKKILFTAATIISGLIGVVAAAIPQIMINKTWNGLLSISVTTDGLMLSQMLWGLKYQRYDTYVPIVPDPIHPSPQIIFSDPVGLRLLEEMQITEFNDWSDFLYLFVQHPIDVCMIYVRHLINFVCPFWPEIYVTDLNTSKWLWGLLGFTIFFLTAFVFVRKCLNSYKSLVYFIPVLIPGILIIPGAVEYRFSLPLYLFALCQLCFNADWKKIKDDVIAHKWSVLFIYLAGALLCFAVWSDMLASESVTPLLF